MCPVVKRTDIRALDIVQSSCLVSNDVGRKECTWILTKYIKCLGSIDFALQGDQL